MKVPELASLYPELQLFSQVFYIWLAGLIMSGLLVVGVITLGISSLFGRSQKD